MIIGSRSFRIVSCDVILCQPTVMVLPSLTVPLRDRVRHLHDAVSVGG